jgi:hypothetical protein
VGDAAGAASPGKIKRRLGSVSELHKERIESLSVEQIETLGEDLLDFTSTADLESWLSRH